jgi:phage FluMu protein Com
MPIDSICTGCGRTLRVADEYAGHEAQCPACSSVYVVPIPQHQPTAQDLPAAPGISEQPPHMGISTLGLFYAITPSGSQYGPVDAATLARWGKEGRLNATCHVLPEHTSHRIPFSEWMAAHDHSVRSATMTVSANSPLQSNTAPGANAFGSIPASYPTTALNQTAGRGVLILVLAIASWVVCITLIGSIPLAAAALYMGIKDLGAMNRYEKSDQDRTITWIGVWLAGINIAATFAFFVIVMLTSL